MIIWDESFIPEESRAAFEAWLAHQVRAAVLEEREVCALLAAGHSFGHVCDCTERTAREIAAAIRARSEPPT